MKKKSRLIPVVQGIAIKFPAMKIVYTDGRKLLEPVAIIHHPYR